MKVLVDTCALVELRQPGGHPAVKATIASIPADSLFLSVLVLGEVARSVTLLTNGRKKKALNLWLTALESQFADHILPVDAETAHLWGDISSRTRQAGLILPVVDGLLAATALHNGLYVMTRTTPPLAATGVLIVDPWQELEQNPDAN